jgi:hypothetical protein
MLLTIPLAFHFVMDIAHTLMEYKPGVVLYEDAKVPCVQLSLLLVGVHWHDVYHILVILLLMVNSICYAWTWPDCSYACKCGPRALRGRETADKQPAHLDLCTEELCVPLVCFPLSPPA